MKNFDLQPHLLGELVELRPLGESDCEALFRAAADPRIWEQHPACDRYQETVFREFFRDALNSGGALVALDCSSGKMIGSSRFCGYDPQTSEVEIGWTFLARAYWGGTYNAEMKRLMLNHAFRFVRRVIFLVGTTNVRSQKAMEKIGGVLTNRRVQRSLGDKTFDHLVYEITKPAALSCRA